MHEYEVIEDPDNISQGDVIEWVGDHFNSPWSTFGIIVTADCDLFRDKHHGFISYVPAWTTEDFLWFHWRPSALEQHRNGAFQTVAKRLSTWRDKNGKGGPVSTDAVRDWLRRAGSTAMLDELGVEDKGQRNTLMDVINPAISLDAALESTKPDIKLLKQAYSFIKSKSGSDPTVMISDIQKDWKSLPGDVFHLPSMPDGTDGDLFVLLRHIRQIRSEDVTARPDDVRFGAAKAKRVAKVTAPYRYAITQNLGKVFSDIGLPLDHEDRRSTTASRFFNRWVNS